MRIGELKERVTLQYQTKTPDGLGGFTTSWVDAATVWAAVWPVSAKETITSMATTMTITHRVRIRYRSVLRSSWRIVYAGRNFNIVSIIDPSEQHRWLDILCKEAA